MTELLFVVCLAASPDVCERQSMQYTDITPHACVMRAPPQLARWAQEHPGWNVQHWSCRVAGRSHEA